MKKEIIPNSESICHKNTDKEISKSMDVNEWLSNFKKGVVEIIGENKELVSGIEADIDHNLLDKSFLNMMASRINSEVKKGRMQEKTAKIVFESVKSKTNEYNVLYKKDIAYNELNADFKYLEK